MFRKYFLCLLMAMVTFGLHAQNDDKLSLDGGDLDSQVRYLIEESNNYQQYEVIPQSWMVKFRKSVNDSVAAFRSEISSLKSQLKAERATITGLRQELQSTQDTLNETRLAQNEMALIGMPMQKTSYRLTMWSIIGILILALVIFIIRFKHSNMVTKDARQKLATLEDEFEHHRKRSLEREQKLRRELQDELNKQRNS